MGLVWLNGEKWLSIELSVLLVCLVFVSFCGGLVNVFRQEKTPLITRVLSDVLYPPKLVLQWYCRMQISKINGLVGLKLPSRIRCLSDNDSS